VSEGPQVFLRARWLHGRLSGRRVHDVRSRDSALTARFAPLRGLGIERVRSHGKRIFLEFEGGLVLHNHQRMRGRWRVLRRFEPLLPTCWIALDVGDESVQNHDGEVLELVTRGDAERIRAELGPDVLDEPFPRAAFDSALRACRLPIAEALLDQSVVSGLGNVARCEAVFLARVDPTRPAVRLADDELLRLGDAVRLVTRESLRQRGRWTHRVYRRDGQPCPRCDARIFRIELPPSRRRFYVCPSCSGMRNERDLFA